MKVRLHKDQKIKIANTKDVYSVMQQILLRENTIGRKQEHFWIIGLDKHNTILFIELIGLGGSNRMSIDPSALFRMAIYKMAVSVIFVHNHPSGDLTPSTQDISTTERFSKIADLIEIFVQDHLIISETDYYSFLDRRIMQSIWESDNYTVIDKEKKRMLELKAKIENQKDIAIKMIQEGFDIEMIKKITGLNKNEIKKLMK